MSAKAPTVRDRLLASARELFYGQGIAATGIDTITRHAGVAKMSLYNNFSSKAELVAAYIEERHVAWLALYARRAESARSPKERVLAVFDAYLDHAALEDSTHAFKGCGMVNAAAELEPGSPVREAIKRHKEQVESLIETQVREIPSASGEQASALAAMFSFLLEGAMVRSGLDGDGGKLRAAKNMVAGMLDDLEPRGVRRDG